MSTVPVLFDLTGRTAFVTGGSRGLGLQIATAVGDQGARVFLTSRKEADLKEAVDFLAGRGIDAGHIAADFADDAQIVRASEAALEALGNVDILVNNAGATCQTLAIDGGSSIN